MNERTLKIVIISVVLFIVSAALSYVVFSRGGADVDISGPEPEPKKGAEGRTVFDESLPKTEECPLNGAKWSKQQKEWWEDRRPLGVMIENHQEARPQSGVTYADVVYEAVAEGGITRFLAVYYCQDAGTVGPVRSARTYFLDWISEYGDYPLYAHVGGANTPGPADALGQIERYGWAAYNDMNQFSLGFPTFWRDYERLGRNVATEHTMYSTTEKLWEAAKKRGLTNKDDDGNEWNENFISYTFKDDAAMNDRPATQKISYSHWPGYSAYNVEWTYNKSGNNYFRVNGGQKHTDKNNNQQLSARTIVVMFMRESRANDGYEGNLHLLYGNKGTGNATVYMDGKAISATWSKANREARTVIRDKSGKEIQFNRGLIWFAILPTGTTVTAN